MLDETRRRTRPRGAVGSAAGEYLGVLTVVSLVLGIAIVALTDSGPRLTAETQAAVCRVMNAAEGGAFCPSSVPSDLAVLPPVAAPVALVAGPAPVVLAQVAVAGPGTTTDAEPVTCPVVVTSSWWDGDDPVTSVFADDTGQCYGADGALHDCTRLRSRTVADDGTLGPEFVRPWSCGDAPAAGARDLTECEVLADGSVRCPTVQEQVVDFGGTGRTAVDQTDLTGVPGGVEGEVEFRNGSSCTTTVTDLGRGKKQIQVTFNPVSGEPRVISDEVVDERQRQVPALGENAPPGSSNFYEVRTWGGEGYGTFSRGANQFVRITVGAVTREFNLTNLHVSDRGSYDDLVRYMRHVDAMVRHQTSGQNRVAATVAAGYLTSGQLGLASYWGASKAASGLATACYTAAAAGWAAYTELNLWLNERNQARSLFRELVVRMDGNGDPLGDDIV